MSTIKNAFQIFTKRREQVQQEKIESVQRLKVLNEIANQEAEKLEQIIRELKESKHG